LVLLLFFPAISNAAESFTGELPVTISVKGIIYRGGETKNLAVIKIDKDLEQVVKVGYEISPDIYVHNITKKYVALKYQNNSYRFTFDTYENIENVHPVVHDVDTDKDAHGVAILAVPAMYRHQGTSGDNAAGTAVFNQPVTSVSNSSDIPDALRSNGLVGNSEDTKN